LKHKTLTLVCIMVMFAMLLTGCGVLNNNDGVTTRNANPGNIVRNLTDNRNNTMYNRDGMRGTTTGIGTRGTGGTYGTTGTGTSGMTSLATGTDLDSQLRNLGFQNTLVIGNTIIVGTTGTTGTTGKTGTTGTTAMGDINRYFGQNTHVLKVTDKQAIKAMQRVKSKMNSNKSLDQASTIAADIKTILKHATPMNNKYKSKSVNH
jgi:hypothetical protein